MRWWGQRPAAADDGDPRRPRRDRRRPPRRHAPPVGSCRRVFPPGESCPGAMPSASSSGRRQRGSGLVRRRRGRPTRSLDDPVPDRVTLLSPFDRPDPGSRPRGGTVGLPLPARDVRPEGEARVRLLRAAPARRRPVVGRAEPRSIARREARAARRLGRHIAARRGAHSLAEFLGGLVDSRAPSRRGRCAGRDSGAGVGRGAGAHLPAGAVSVPGRGDSPALASSPCRGSVGARVRGRRRGGRRRADRPGVAGRAVRGAGAVGERHRSGASRERGAQPRAGGGLRAVPHLLGAGRQPARAPVLRAARVAAERRTRVVPYPPNPLDVSYTIDLE